VSAPTDDLVRAVAAVERDARRVRDRLRDAEDITTTAEENTLALVAELAGCLRRLLPGRTVSEIHNAFGAPGDFGYETALGDALARFYRGGAP